LALCVWLPASASANSKVRKKVQRITTEAMESYDLLEYEAARKGLRSALLLAKSKGLGQDEAAGKVHLHLGIIEFSGFEDKEAAKLEFASALEISSDLELPKAYATKEMQAFFNGIKADFDGGGTTDEPTSDDGACATVSELEHELVETAPAGSAQAVDVRVSPELEVGKASLFYREDGGDKFKQLTMGRQGKCVYSGKIPAASVRGSVLHYYVAIAGKGGKVIAKSGDKFSPNLMEITAPKSGDGEDPFGSGGGGEVETSVKSSGPRKRVFVSVSAGSGGGYVTGTTEATTVDVECCFAPALFHLAPEVGYWFGDHVAVSAALRLGFPIGANVPGHATASPAGFARLRYAFGGGGTGFQVNGAVGAGIIRHTVKISNAAPGEDTDTTATGPLILGAGVGYIKALGDSLRFLAELNALLGLAVVDQIGCPGNGCVEPNFGAQFDFNLGLMVAF